MIFGKYFGNVWAKRLSFGERGEMIGLLSYRGSSGKIYKLNHNLGEGGEGIVYGLLDDDKHAA